MWRCTFLHAVRGPLALEVVPLHDAREAAALGHAGDIDGLDAVEGFDGDVLADLGPPIGAAQLANESLRLAAGLRRAGSTPAGAAFGSLAFEIGNMTTFTAAGQAARLIEKAELDRFVAIALLGADLEHVTRAGLHDGDGDALSRFVVNLASSRPCGRVFP